MYDKDKLLANGDKCDRRQPWAMRPLRARTQIHHAGLQTPIFSAPVLAALRCSKIDVFAAAWRPTSGQVAADPMRSQPEPDSAVIQAAVFYPVRNHCRAAVRAVMVILRRNPVHSVLWLIVAFFNAAGLFLLLGAEFLAMILVIVYVGAVAVLFLFVVMMLDIDFATLRAGFGALSAAGLLISGSCWRLLEILLVAGQWASRRQVSRCSTCRSPTRRRG
jgi:NADH:ubiquinone oxidoreductase subunit 6 (subunit J)